MKKNTCILLLTFVCVFLTRCEDAWTEMESEADKKLLETQTEQLPLSTHSAKPCTAHEKSNILAPANHEGHSVQVKCNLTLTGKETITKRLILEGSGASGVTINCNGATLNGDYGTYNEKKDMIEVRSKKTSQADSVYWERPEDIVIKNCNIIGSIRIWGMGKNGEATEVRSSSRQDSLHRYRLRDNAPRRITLDHLTITGVGRNPVYFAPGVWQCTLRHSEIQGESTGVALYLDTESGGHEIRNNYFHVTSRKEYGWGPFKYVRKREEIAIDTSSNNLIINNRLSTMEGGGIYLYRNCGEGGTVRHSNPSFNQIINNVFVYKKYTGDNPPVWIGSRGNQKSSGQFYCDDDKGYSWGSSRDNRNFAQYNIVAQNQVYRKPKNNQLYKLRDDGSNLYNTITKNTYVDYGEEVSRKSGCYTSSGYKKLLLHNETIDVTKYNSSAPSCSDWLYKCHDGKMTFQYLGHDSTCHLTPIPFECKVTGDNGGCYKSIQCPAGEKIVGIQAACNLEWGTLTSDDLTKIGIDSIEVVKPSQNEKDGICTIGEYALRAGKRDIADLLDRTHIDFGCKEHDKNGGDCHIRGVLFCR